MKLAKGLRRWKMRSRDELMLTLFRKLLSCLKRQTIWKSSHRFKPMSRYFFNSSCQRNYNLRYSRTGVFGEIKRRFILNIQIKAFVVKELKHWWKRDRTMASNISKIEILRINYSTISTIKVSNKHNVICNSLTTIKYFLIQKFFYKIKSTTYLWRKS